MSETETYIVQTKTERSSVAVGTQDPGDALKRAREMARTGHQITITDRDGNVHTLEEMAANVASGVYAKPCVVGAVAPRTQTYRGASI